MREAQETLAATFNWGPIIGDSESFREDARYIRLRGPVQTKA